MFGDQDRQNIYHLHELIHKLISQGESIMHTQAELVADLKALRAQVEKSRTENLAKIAELKQLLINADHLTPEADAALDDLKASVQASDDDNPDAPPA